MFAVGDEIILYYFYILPDIRLRFMVPYFDTIERNVEKHRVGEKRNRTNNSLVRRSAVTMTSVQGVAVTFMLIRTKVRGCRVIL